jgi:hypothetical protein
VHEPGEHEPGEHELVVSFCGDARRLQLGDTLTFGRAGDIAIDDNPFLHRHLGLLFSRGDSWWLQNTGSQIQIGVRDLDTNSHISAAAGAEVPLPFRRALLTFDVSRTHYEIELEISGTAEPLAPPPRETAGSPTVHIGEMALNEEQRLLLVALALPRLREPHRPDRPLPSNQDVATLLGWSITKYNRKLDYLCEKFERAGLHGLRGERGELATQRRQRLVQYALDSKLIGLEDIPATWPQTIG